MNELPIEQQAERYLRLCSIAARAEMLESFLKKHAGETADWPIRLVVSDSAIFDRLNNRLESLRQDIAALKEFDWKIYHPELLP